MRQKNPCRGEPSSPSPGSQAPPPEGVPSLQTPEGVPSLGAPWVEFQWRPTYHLRAQTPWPGVIPDGPSPGPNPNRSRPLKLRMRILVVAYPVSLSVPRWRISLGPPNVICEIEGSRSRNRKTLTLKRFIDGLLAKQSFYLRRGELSDESRPKRSQASSLIG